MTETTWTPATIALSKLKPWERNPKRISKAHAARLLDLWERLGQFQTIAIGPDGEVYDGHQRLSVLKAKHGGSYQVQVLQASRPLTEAEREELTIAAHSGTTGSWDWDALAGWDVGNLTAWGLDEELLSDWNAGATALREMLAAEAAPTGEDPGPQVDKAAELQAKWQTATGQLWLLDSGNGYEHRLICGDCTDREVVARVMGGEKAALCFTSPPYADMRNYGGNDVSARTLVGFVLPAIEHSEYQVVNLGLKFTDGEVVAWWEVYLNEFKERGQKLLAWNVWDKQGQVSIASATNMFYVTHEWLFVFGVSPKKLNRIIPNDLAAYRSRFGENFLRGIDNNFVRQKDGTTKVTTSTTYTHHQLHSVYAQTPELGSIRGAHPATFPVGLPSAYVLSMTDNYDLVYEPFSGSGTTLIACERLGRRCRAVEIAPGYVAVALERWATMTGKTPVLVDGGDNG